MVLENKVLRTLVLENFYFLLLRWVFALILGFVFGKLVSLVKLPSILGWLAAGMVFGPKGLCLVPQFFMEEKFYRYILSWMQCSFGIMLGSELIWKRLKAYGKALVVTTLFQSLGTFFIVTAVFALVGVFVSVPLYLAFIFGAIALATAPAPALSIVREFHTKGPVTETLLPMAVLDDVVGIVVFFFVNALVAGSISGGSLPLYMIPLIILIPLCVGAVPGLLSGLLLKKTGKKPVMLLVILLGIFLTAATGIFLNEKVFTGITINYMLAGVSFSAVFSNLLEEEKLEDCLKLFNPILLVSLLTAVFDLGAPLDWHLISGAGIFTFFYIASRAFGKYFGAFVGAKITGLPKTVQEFLGLTLLPHSGVSLVFTGIACSTIQAVFPEDARILQGTVAAAAIINEIIAVVAAKKGFELAGECSGSEG